MSILSMRPGRTERQESIPPAPAIPYAPRPKPVPPGPHQLGAATLANVETLTSLSAEQIEKLADAVETAAHDEAEGLREFAQRLRVSGRLANENLANFVRVASTVADAAGMMQQSVLLRNEPDPEPHAVADTPAADPPSSGLDKLAEALGTHESADHE